MIPQFASVNAIGETVSELARETGTIAVAMLFLAMLSLGMVYVASFIISRQMKGLISDTRTASENIRIAAETNRLTTENLREAIKDLKR